MWCDGMTKMPDTDAKQLDQEVRRLVFSLSRWLIVRSSLLTVLLPCPAPVHAQRFMELAREALLPKILASYADQVQKKVFSK